MEQGAAPAGPGSIRDGLLIEGRGITRIYDAAGLAVPALRGVSFGVWKGEFVAVMGPSGSGKSTLLHLLGGLDRPTSGRVVVQGTDLGALSETALTLFRRTATGFVFQYFNLLPTLNVFENIALPLLIAGRRVKEYRERVEDLIELLGLRGREGRPVAQLSAGEQQRVAIAKALLTEPALLLADEPTGNLDRTTGMEVLQLLWESCDNFGQTILVVTHDAKVATFADRVLFLQDGTLFDELVLGRRLDHYDVRPVVARAEKLGI